MYRHYYGGHYIWNNGFGKIRGFRAGRLHIPGHGPHSQSGVENDAELYLLQPQCLPVQHIRDISRYSPRGSGRISGSGYGTGTTPLTYQATSDSDILPASGFFTIYSSMYLYFEAFRALTVQIGVDCNYYTRYRGMMYQPATMAFHVQETTRHISVDMLSGTCI